MGFTYVTVRLYNPANMEKGEEARLLVDSGAIYSCLPASLLERLGLRPIRRRKLRAFGGAVMERDMGYVVIEYEENMTPIPVIFGGPEDTPILGVTALESLGYELDPITKQLKPVELLMM